MEPRENADDDDYDDVEWEDEKEYEQREEEKQKQEEEQRRPPTPEGEFEECVICGYLLNNSAGKMTTTHCKDNCIDVVNVCKNNHKFHRGCILDWCNVGSVNIAGQMGFQMQHYSEQNKRNTCPICVTTLIPTCQELAYVQKVSTEELLEESGKMDVTGGKKRYKKSKTKKRKSKNKFKKSKRKSKNKYKKSKRKSKNKYKKSKRKSKNKYKKSKINIRI
jgi:hypothetical protein